MPSAKICYFLLLLAPMAELVDAVDSKSIDADRACSSQARGTICLFKIIFDPAFKNMPLSSQYITRKFYRYIKKPSLLSLFALFSFIGVKYFYQEYPVIVFKSRNVRIVDGDTLVLAGKKIRLQGIDAPESKQFCKEALTLKSFPCGQKATEYLISLTKNQEIGCSDEGKDRYGRQLSYCYAGSVNVNREMVRHGWAVAYYQYDVVFVKEEVLARYYKENLWNSQFTRPNIWRKLPHKN